MRVQAALRLRVAHVMAHGGGAGRENRDVGAALALKFELRGLQLFADLVVADMRRRGRFRVIVERGDLLLAEFDKGRGLGSVMPVTIDNHLNLQWTSRQNNVAHNFAPGLRVRVAQPLLAVRVLRSQSFPVCANIAKPAQLRVAVLLAAR